MTGRNPDGIEDFPSPDCPDVAYGPPRLNAIIGAYGAFLDRVRGTDDLSFHLVLELPATETPPAYRHPSRTELDDLDGFRFTDGQRPTRAESAICRRRRFGPQPLCSPYVATTILCLPAAGQVTIFVRQWHGRTGRPGWRASPPKSMIKVFPPAARHETGWRVPGPDRRAAPGAPACAAACGRRAAMQGLAIRAVPPAPWPARWWRACSRASQPRRRASASPEICAGPAAPGLTRCTAATGICKWILRSHADGVSPH